MLVVTASGGAFKRKGEREIKMARESIAVDLVMALASPESPLMSSGVVIRTGSILTFSPED